MKAKLKSLSEIVEGKDISNKTYERASFISRYLDSNVNEIIDSSIEICFPKTIMLEGVVSTIDPKTVINSFISAAKAAYPTSAYWDCIRANQRRDFTKAHIAENLLETKGQILDNIYYELDSKLFKVQIMIEALQNQVLGELGDNAMRIKANLQSTVIGLDYGILTSNPIYMIGYELDNIRAIKRQQNRADSEFARLFFALNNNAAIRLTNQYEEYKRDIFVPYIEDGVISLFNEFKEMLVLYEVYTE